MSFGEGEVGTSPGRLTIGPSSLHNCLPRGELAIRTLGVTPTLVATGVGVRLRAPRGQVQATVDTTTGRHHYEVERLAAFGQFAREWFLLELFGHAGLILLRQICGTWWSWRTGGPFAYWD